MTCRYCEAPPGQCNHCDRCGEPSPECVCVQGLKPHQPPTGTQLTRSEEGKLVTMFVPLRVAKRVAEAVRYALENEECCDNPDCLCGGYEDDEDVLCAITRDEMADDLTCFLRILFNQASEELGRDWGFFSDCMDGEHRQALRERFGQ